MRSDPSIRYQPAIELLKLVIIHRLKLMPSNCFELSNIGQEKPEPRIQNIKSSLSETYKFIKLGISVTMLNMWTFWSTSH